MTAPTGAADWHADTIAWQELGADGTRYALLEGRRDQAGEPFSYAFFIPAGFGTLATGTPPPLACLSPVARFTLATVTRLIWIESRPIRLAALCASQPTRATLMARTKTP